MDFDSIMTSITSRLTENSGNEIPYLKEQIEKYRNHPYAKEITRACGRLMYEFLPDDRKEEFGKALGNDAAGLNSALDEIRYTAFKGDHQKALSLVEAVVKKAEDLSSYADDEVSAYFTFSEPFEEILYRHRNNPTKTLRQAQLPYADIYALYGSILFELKKYPEAKEALGKAIRWNPINASIAFEYAETHKMLGDINSYLTLTKDIMDNVFRPKDLARCYRNLAYYFVEERLYDVATGCLFLSLEYDKDSTIAQSELFYIQDKAGGKLSRPTPEQFREYADQHELPLGASNDLIGLAYTYGKHFLDKKEFDGARYFLEIVYGLTSDDDIQGLLHQIPDHS